MRYSYRTGGTPALQPPTLTNTFAGGGAQFEVLDDDELGWADTPLPPSMSHSALAEELRVDLFVQPNSRLRSTF